MLQVMINSRHQDALTRAPLATQRTIDALRAETTLELAAMDSRIAVNAVGEIVGKTATEDLLKVEFQPVLHREMKLNFQVHSRPIPSMPLRFKSSGVIAMRNSTSA